MRMVNIYRLTDIDTNEVVLEGTADKFAKKGLYHGFDKWSFKNRKIIHG